MFGQSKEGCVGIIDGKWGEICPDWERISGRRLNRECWGWEMLCIDCLAVAGVLRNRLEGDMKGLLRSKGWRQVTSHALLRHNVHVKTKIHPCKAVLQISLSLSFSWTWKSCIWEKKAHYIWPNITMQVDRGIWLEQRRMQVTVERAQVKLHGTICWLTGVPSGTAQIEGTPSFRWKNVESTSEARTLGNALAVLFAVWKSPSTNSEKLFIGTEITFERLSTPGQIQNKEVFEYTFCQFSEPPNHFTLHFKTKPIKPPDR